MSGTPGIVLKCQYDRPTKTREIGSVASYYAYMNRFDEMELTDTEDRIDPTIERYTTYMEDEQKTRSLGVFTGERDTISETERADLIARFDDSIERDGHLLKDVVSFDNRWLEEQKLYDARTDRLDEGRLRDAVRDMMDGMGKKMDRDDLLWVGSIHRNTDNIHVHIATVGEQEPLTEQEAFRKDAVRDTMKSRLLSGLTDRDVELERLRALTRDRIVEPLRDERLAWSDPTLDRHLDEIRRRLPAQKKEQNYKKIKEHHPELRELIDRASTHYLETHKATEWTDLKAGWEREQRVHVRAYGGSPRFERQYADNRRADLYQRLGNTLLTQAKARPDVTEDLALPTMGREKGTPSEGQPKGKSTPDTRKTGKSAVPSVPRKDKRRGTNGKPGRGAPVKPETPRRQSITALAPAARALPISDGRLLDQLDRTVREEERRHEQEYRQLRARAMARERDELDR
ncbi:hypothetical protein EXIGUO8H_130006 [Exiguobacterium sp. 8H]|uniref:MobP2 family relaxase n=1 Tax=unclassified Exiguobacterium TaxID=2644629 RepID=UPI0012F3AAD1|nr:MULTISPECIES: MobP2 family relaxase [unclassified Exiguobacterium]VXB38635.1 hypothetical protein EXIGUO8H_130006 [Exiguobacterium sp. 8H]VXB96575.1 hypothetical protein EXIGUO8A_340006 [Exiguobacterium sp. 8A]